VKTVFQCDKCSQYFEDPRECAEHEVMKHRKPAQIEGYNDYRIGDRYPWHLKVRMEDGALIDYRFDQVREAPRQNA